MPLVACQAVASPILAVAAVAPPAACPAGDLVCPAVAVIYCPEAAEAGVGGGGCEVSSGWVGTEAVRWQWARAATDGVARAAATVAATVAAVVVTVTSGCWESVMSEEGERERRWG